MENSLVIRGVPARLQRDAWWFTDAAEDAPIAPVKTDGTRLAPTALGGAALLVILADVLFWDADPGISVALYALALSAMMLALKPGGVTRREAGVAMAFTLACNLPVIEQLQPLSVVFSIGGVAGVLTWVARGQITGAVDAVWMFASASTLGAMVLPVDAAREVQGAHLGSSLRRLVRAGTLPLAIGLVFGVLFMVANPLVENALSMIHVADLLTPDQVQRLAFWSLIACAVWPYLNTQARWQIDAPQANIFTLQHGDGPVLNTASVQTSLILFNVMFAVQTVTDLGVLSGGMALPEGMSYATYAHRGAYPLLITALLSGGFSLITHAFIAKSPLMRGLMYIWLGQTIFLVITAAIRLSLYVQAYTLTHMRIAAFIWMGLILIALVLIVVRMVKDRPTSWLVHWNAMAGVATLYVCCFVNFAYIITSYNMANTPVETLDLRYLCNLGEQAIPAMMDYGQITDQTACGRGSIPSIRFVPIEDWQEWGFRRWRLQRYLQAYHDL